MKVTITGDAFALTSSIKVEDIKMLKKQSPDSLKIKDDENNDIFGIDYVEGCPSITKFGITFGGVSRDGKGFATLTGTIPSGTANAKDYVADTLGSAASMLKDIETVLPDIIKEINDNRTAFINGITVA